VVGKSRATFYRTRKPGQLALGLRTNSTSQSLTPAEKAELLTHLHSERFLDRSVRQVYAALLDEGCYLGSISTMYRLLRENQQVQERRRQSRHQKHTKPVLVATGPNQIWTWDITKLRGPAKGSGYRLYVVLDIFSRCVVGWLVAERECQHLAAQLIETACQRHGISRDALTLHADRGGPMVSKTVSELLCDLGVTRSHSRPRVSNDNPFSEAQFKTVKYAPEFPGHFQSIEEARVFCAAFLNFYNTRQYHTGIALLTPEMVHLGKATTVQQARQATLNEAYAKKPVRFSKGAPHVLPLHEQVCINRVEPQTAETDPKVH
jgi:putative transposase